MIALLAPSARLMAAIAGSFVGARRLEVRTWRWVGGEILLTAWSEVVAPGAAALPGRTESEPI